MRTCLKCGKEKDTNQFEYSKGGYAKNCKSCDGLLEAIKGTPVLSEKAIRQFEEKMSKAYWEIREVKANADKEFKEGRIDKKIYGRICQWYDVMVRVHDEARF